MPFWCFPTCRFSSGRDQTRRWHCLACRCPAPPRFSAEGSDGDTLCGPKSSSSPHVYLRKKALARPLKDRYKKKKSIFIREVFADVWSSSTTISAVLEWYLTGPCMSWWGGRSGSPPGSRTCGCLVGWCRSDCRCPAQHIRQCLQTESRGALRRTLKTRLSNLKISLKSLSKGRHFPTSFKLSPSQVFLSIFRLYPAGQEQLKPTFRSLQSCEQPPLLSWHSLTSVGTQTQMIQGSRKTFPSTWFRRTATAGSH